MKIYQIHCLRGSQIQALLSWVLLAQGTAQGYSQDVTRAVTLSIAWSRKIPQPSESQGWQVAPEVHGRPSFFPNGLLQRLLECPHDAVDDFS